MKKNIFYLSGTVLITLFSILIFDACQKPTLSLELPRAIGPVSIQITDANPAATTNPANPTVKITGENALDVVNFLNKLEFTPQNGLITIGLKKGSTPSEAKPYRFNVVVTAEGYLSTVQPIVVTEDKIQVVTLSMINLKAPPTSALVTTKNFTAGDAAAIQSPALNVNVAAGTTMTDANGAALSGNVSSTMVGFDIKSNDTQLAFPGGFVQNKIKNAKGALVDGGVFSPIALMALEMNVNNNAVKNFSKPIAVSVSLASGLKNEKTQNDVKVGDELGLYSMDKGGSEWAEQGTVKVVSDGKGGLKVDFTTDHLTFYNIGILSSFCANGTTVKLSGFQANETYYCIFTNRFTNQLLSTTATPVSTDAAGNGSVRLRNMPLGSAYTARIFPSPIWTYGGVGLPPIAEIATPFVGCGTTVTATCGNCQPRTGSVNFTIKIKCDGNATNLETNIDAPVWFRPYNPANPAGPWRYLGYVLDGKLSTNDLTIGNRYDFVTFYGPAWTGYTVKSANITEVRSFCP